MIKELIHRNRSIRRYHEDHIIKMDELLTMLESARLSASARNSQPLKYYLSSNREMNQKIFPCLAWAGYLKDWDGPDSGERPSAYIIQLHDTGITSDYFCDDGIAAQSILLTAVEMGYGGCIIASVKRELLSKILGLPEHLKIIQVISLGIPAETVVIEEIAGNDIKYWRDENGIHHVPKRSLKEIVYGKSHE